MLVCPPRSQTWNVKFLYVTCSTLKPIVGIVVTTSPTWNKNNFRRSIGDNVKCMGVAYYYSFYSKDGPSSTSLIVYFCSYKQTIQFLQQYNVKKCPKNGPSSTSLIVYFCSFKQTIQFLQQYNVKKCPSSIRCWDPPITTRPGLPTSLLWLWTCVTYIGQEFCQSCTIGLNWILTHAMNKLSCISF